MNSTDKLSNTRLKDKLLVLIIYNFASFNARAADLTNIYGARPLVDITKTYGATPGAWVTYFGRHANFDRPVNTYGATLEDWVAYLTNKDSARPLVDITKTYGATPGAWVTHFDRTDMKK